MLVTDQFTNVIYFSDRLENECPELFHSVVKLQEQGLPVRFFKGGKSMWARDYMPIQVRQDYFVAFRYNPSYLNDTEAHKATITDNAAEICQSLFGHKINVLPTDILLDGGNVIKCDNSVVMTDKVLHDNPNYSTSKLIHELEFLFNSEIVLIPWDRNEPIYGHADGVMRHVDDSHYLFAKYPDKCYIKEVQSHFSNVKNKTFYMPSGATIKHQPYLWAYINYIRTFEYILFPALSPKADCAEDVCVASQFRKLFSEYMPENIIPVYALPSLKFGGGLHCCSWNVMDICWSDIPHSEL